MPRAPELAARLAVALAAAAALGLAFGGRALQLALPLVDFALDLLLPGFATWLEVAGGEVRLHIVTLAPLALPGERFIPAASNLGRATCSLDHALVPMVLVLAALSAWPAGSRRESALRVLAAPVLCLAALLLTLPFHLAGLLQAALALESWTVHYMVFLEMGGRWLLPVLLAAACVLAVRAATELRLKEAWHDSVYYYYWRSVRTLAEGAMRRRRC